MERLDPRVRIAVVILMSVLCFLLRHPATIAAAFVVALLLWRAVGLGWEELLAGIKPLRVVFVLVIAAQAFFFPGDTPVRVDLPGLGLVTLPMTVEGIGFGLLLCLRVLVLACTVPILTSRTSIDRIVLALTRLGLSYRTAYTVTTALNQIPVLRADIATISAAQRLRGSLAFERGHFLTKIRAYPALVVPLVMTSMRRATLMSVAMQSRAFGSGAARTSIHSLSFRRLDALVLCVSIILFGVLVGVDRIV